MAPETKGGMAEESGRRLKGRRGSEVNPPVTLFSPEKPAHPILGPRCTTGGALLGTRAGERDQDCPDSDDTGEEELTSSHIPKLDSGDEVVTSGAEPNTNQDNHEASEDETEARKYDPEASICKDNPRPARTTTRPGRTNM